LAMFYFQVEDWMHQEASRYKWLDQQANDLILLAMLQEYVWSICCFHVMLWCSCPELLVISVLFLQFDKSSWKLSLLDWINMGSVFVVELLCFKNWSFWTEFYMRLVYISEWRELWNGLCWAGILWAM
jgi:hypothetical protein